MSDYERLEEYDKNKTKVLKYVLYKKRTENEIKKKFERCIDSKQLEEIIYDLKENKYIDDTIYIQRAVNEFIALRNLSLKQIKYKLLSKGISNDLIEEYFYYNKDELDEYERKSIENILNKKNELPNEELIQMLLKKGFEYDNLKGALERRN